MEASDSFLVNQQMIFSHTVVPKNLILNYTLFYYQFLPLCFFLLCLSLYTHAHTGRQSLIFQFWHICIRVTMIWLKITNLPEARFKLQLPECINWSIVWSTNFTAASLVHSSPCEWTCASQWPATAPHLQRGGAWSLHICRSLPAQAAECVVSCVSLVFATMNGMMFYRSGWSEGRADQQRWTCSKEMESDDPETEIQTQSKES